jgi:hypothetical protein
MTDWGIKITKPGTAVTTTDPRLQLLNTKYTMLKFHSITDTTVTINAGSATGSATVSHSLGYVPAFMAFAYGSDPWVQQLDDAGQIIPIYTSLKSGNPNIESYVNSTGVTTTVTLPENYNEYRYDWTNPSDLYDDKFGARSYTVTGHKDGIGRSHAIKFDGVAVGQGSTIVSANLDHYAETRWVSSPAQDMKLKTYGIDTNTCDSFDSNPMGRDKTTAVTSQTQVVPATGEYFGTNVTSQVQEIINRAGWSSGNDIGFLVFDDNGPDGNALEDDSANHKLSITTRVAGSITFKIRVIIFKDKIAT